MTKATSPLTELTIRRNDYEDGYDELKVRIDDEGGLVLDGVDAGPTIAAVVGDWDHEYTETVSQAWKDSVLLHLVKERFDKISDFRTWCEERGIPTVYSSW